MTQLSSSPLMLIPEPSLYNDGKIPMILKVNKSLHKYRTINKTSDITGKIIITAFIWYKNYFVRPFLKVIGIEVLKTSQFLI